MFQGLIDPSFVTVTDNKSKSTSTTLFFYFLPLSFLRSLSFTIHYKCVTGSRRVERGEQCVVTLSPALQLSAWFQLLLPAGRGGPGRRPSTQLPLHPSSTTRINRSATPYKRSTDVHASQYNARPTTSNLCRTEREGARLRWRVITGKYEIWNGRGK